MFVMILLELMRPKIDCVPNEISINIIYYGNKLKCVFLLSLCISENKRLQTCQDKIEHQQKNLNLICSGFFTGKKLVCQISVKA